ncbi:hypothetical protein GCM10010446_25470 [Streptomyces enissocaesilis]|uniref:Uncharacterized protein n=1 Tax=Streptomyces enissocaesilis TaxID=332589 RepID=A0ABN3X650_9ACTN
MWQSVVMLGASHLLPTEIEHHSPRDWAQPMNQEFHRGFPFARPRADASSRVLTCPILSCESGSKRHAMGRCRRRRR